MRRILWIAVVTALLCMGLQSINKPPLRIDNDSAYAPLRLTERSAAPSTPSTGDIYLDDGTLAGSTLPLFRRYAGIAWENIGQAYDADLDTWAGITPHAAWQDILDGTLTTRANALAARANLNALPVYHSDDYASINAAVTAIGATAATLHVTTSETLAANLTVPATCALRIDKGGMIVKASTYTLTVNGSFEAGLYQCFSGFAAGNVTLAKVKEVIPQWWGATGDGSTVAADMTAETAAITAAITAAHVTPHKTLYFPAGTYVINTALTMSDVTGIPLVGDNKIGATIKAGATMTAIFNITAVGGVYPEIRNLYLDCNSKADYGIYAPDGAYNHIENCTITGALHYAISMTDSWCSDIVGCEIKAGAGGIEFGGASNGCSIVRCRIHANTGIGILSLDSAGVVIRDSVIEDNDETGIYLRSGNNSVVISGNYFELNGSVGKVYDTPAATIKAEVIADGSAVLGTMAHAYPTGGLMFQGNYMNSAADVNSAFYLIGANGVTVTSNHENTSGIPMVATIDHSTYSGIDGLVLSGNRVTDANQIEVNGGLGTAETDNDLAHTWRIDQTNRRNYFPQNYLNWSASGGTGSSIGRGTGTHQGQPIIDIYHNDGASDLYYATLDIANDHPELLDQYVWLGCWFKYATGTLRGFTLYTPNGYDSSSNIAGDGTWQFHSRVYKIAADATTLNFGVQKLGTADVHLYITPPMLCQLGTPYDDAETQPYEFREALVAEGGIVQDVNNIVADIVNFSTHGVNIVNSSGGAVTGALVDGVAVGQTVKIVCKVAGNNIDITVAHHVTSDPEVIRLDTAKEAVELVWDGTDWVETDVVGAVSYP